MKTLTESLALATVALCCFALPNLAYSQDSTSLAVQMRDGNIYQIDAVDDSFNWKSVAPDGTITESVVKLSNVKSLLFTISPASDEVVRIRTLVSGLASDDYRERHKAERILLDEGKPFEKVIEQARDHSEPEVRYRVNRILDFLADVKNDNATRFSIDFDILTLNNGSVLEGDIGDWKIKGQWNGNPISIGRETGYLAMQSLPFENWSAPDTATLASMNPRNLTDPYEFYNEGKIKERRVLTNPKPGFSQANFDVGAKGEKMISDRDFEIGHMFAHQGCLLNCETFDGFVVISGYKFKSSPSRNRSVGNFFIERHTLPILWNVLNKKKPLKVSYKGVMRIDFCMPGTQKVPASVNTVALFAEIVKPRQTLVEAYNSMGHVIGLTYAPKAKNAFMGFESPQAIAYLKVTANEHLKLAKLNRDFAVDDLTYSELTPAPFLNYADLARDDQVTPTVIVTRDNQRLLVSSFQFTDGTIDAKSFPENNVIKLSVDNVAWITPPQPREMSPPEGGGVYAMLGDGSVVHCLVQQGLVSSMDEGIEIDTADIVGVWGSDSQCRYPLTSDFEKGNVVLVRPINRVAFTETDFDWKNAVLDYSFNNATNIFQSWGEATASGVMNSEAADKVALGIDAEADNPGSIKIEDSGYSFWTAQPPVVDSTLGILRTKDGQQFVLGGNSGFKLVEINDQSLTIRHGQTDKEISFENVHALKLPK